MIPTIEQRQAPTPLPPVTECMARFCNEYGVALRPIQAALIAGLDHAIAARNVICNENTWGLTHLGGINLHLGSRGGASTLWKFLQHAYPLPVHIVVESEAQVKEHGDMMFGTVVGVEDPENKGRYQVRGFSFEDHKTDEDLSWWTPYIHIPQTPRQIGDRVMMHSAANLTGYTATSLRKFQKMAPRLRGPALAIFDFGGPDAYAKGDDWWTRVRSTFAELGESQVLPILS